MINPGVRDKFLKYFTLTVILLIVGVGTCTLYPTWKRGEALRREEAELQERIRAKEQAIAKLEENERRFRTDPDFVEKIARQNRRVFPGELVFIFED